MRPSVSGWVGVHPSLCFFFFHHLGTSRMGFPRYLPAFLSAYSSQNSSIFLSKSKPKSYTKRGSQSIQTFFLNLKQLTLSFRWGPHIPYSNLRSYSPALTLRFQVPGWIQVLPFTYQAPGPGRTWTAWKGACKSTWRSTWTNFNFNLDQPGTWRCKLRAGLQEREALLSGNESNPPSPLPSPPLGHLRLMRDLYTATVINLPALSGD